MNDLMEIQSYVKDVVSRRIWNHLDREDVAGEVFLALCRGDYRGDSSYKTYVYSIAKRRINDHFRSKYKRLVAEASCMEAMNIDFNDDFVIRDLNRCISRLPKSERFIIILYDLSELDFGEISRIMGRSRRRVREVRRRGLRLLRVMLENRGYGNVNRLF